MTETSLLDMIVQLPGGRSKRLGDCTGLDLDAAIDFMNRIEAADLATRRPRGWRGRQ